MTAYEKKLVNALRSFEPCCIFDLSMRQPSNISSHLITLAGIVMGCLKLEQPKNILSQSVTPSGIITSSLKLLIDISFSLQNSMISSWERTTKGLLNTIKPPVANMLTVCLLAAQCSKILIQAVHISGLVLTIKMRIDFRCHMHIRMTCLIFGR